MMRKKTGSMSNQAELFDLDHSAQELLRGIEEMPADELKHRWPQRLAELVDVTTAVLARRGRTMEQARDDAAAVVAAIAHYLGGRMLYLPSAEKLRIAIRDRRIWSERDDYTVPQLADRYGLTEIMIYQILREQRSIYIRRVQRRLFDGG